MPDGLVPPLLRAPRAPTRGCAGLVALALARQGARARRPGAALAAHRPGPTPLALSQIWRLCQLGLGRGSGLNLWNEKGEG